MPQIAHRPIFIRYIVFAVIRNRIQSINPRMSGPTQIATYTTK